jgi:hypothetical protein
LWTGFETDFSGVRDGLGLHLADIDLTEKAALRQALFYCYFAEIFYALSLAFSKFAILAFYWRLFSTSSIRIPIIILALASLAWLILRVCTSKPKTGDKAN